MKAFKPSKKLCAHKPCGKPFMTEKPMQVVCGPYCGVARARDKVAAKRAREAVVVAKLERQKHREDKERIKTLNEHKSDTQDAFNAWVRERDFDLPCVSCGETNPPQKVGGKWDAGHFLSRGARPDLRFNPDNCFKQCKSCNGGGGRFKHKERTVSQDYEIELVKRIGIDRVEILKGPPVSARWTVEELNVMKKQFRADTRALVKLRELRNE